MRSLLWPAVLLAALPSCAAPAVQVPSVEVQAIRLVGVRLPTAAQPAQAKLSLHLLVTNPNPLPLRLLNAAGTLVVNGQKVGDYALPRINLPAHGSAEQTLNLALPLDAGAAAAVLKVARGQEVSYRLDGSLTADLGALGQPTFGPFTLAQGVWKQEPVLPY